MSARKHQRPKLQFGNIPPKCTLDTAVIWYQVGALIPYPNNPRRHPEEQLKALERSIDAFGFARPIIIDESNTVLAGHGCLEAAKRLSLKQVPTLRLNGLSEAQKRALVIADNRIAGLSEWNNFLKDHLTTLIDVDFDVELTGFSMGAIDILLQDKEADQRQAAEVIEDLIIAGPAVSRQGDLWALGRHLLFCGDARKSHALQTLLGADLAQMIITDPPYNVRIQGHARGRSKTKQREFAMASGEMSTPQFIGFLEACMARAVQFSSNGSIHYWFIDWRHLPDLIKASGSLYKEWKNLLVWCKSNAGQGSFYRSQHELICAFKSGNRPHINNFGLGKEGRTRTNLLNYPGGATPDAARQEELAMHPTVKPIALIADLIRDCSKRNGLILDLFGGSGTSILGAELTDRCARVVEIDPLYVDLSIRRWQRQTGKKATHGVSGESFDEIATRRLAHG